MTPPAADVPGESRPAAPQLGPAVSRPLAPSARAEDAAELLPPFVPPWPTPPEAHGPGVRGEQVDGDTGAAALGAVAERLERVAAGLRRGSVAELLARVEMENADPLEVLITGYALGYAEAARRRG